MENIYPFYYENEHTLMLIDSKIDLSEPYYFTNFYLGIKNINTPRFSQIPLTPQQVPFFEKLEKFQCVEFSLVCAPSMRNVGFSACIVLAIGEIKSNYFTLAHETPNIKLMAKYCS